MFRKKPVLIADLLNRVMRENGLETPLLQKRIIDGWDVVMNKAILRYTQDKYIKNQTLFVKLSNPALRNDLNMTKSEIVQKLNNHVGSYVISDIKFY